MWVWVWVWFEIKIFRVSKAGVGENGSVDLGVFDLIGLPAKTGDLRLIDIVVNWVNFVEEKEDD
ncbi:hypothetical protein Hanom_Chr03g00183591 [Helianthus anomalus]